MSRNALHAPKDSVVWDSLKITHLLQKLEQAVGQYGEPMAFRLVEEYGRDPFLILIACLLSLRSRDTKTYHVARKLFGLASTPSQMLSIPVREFEALLKPLGMFRQKTKVIRSVSQQLLDQFSGKVPCSKARLLSLTGVGPKTANLVLSVGFHRPAICVDVHVHRIANRLGWVHTKTPEQTEYALMHSVPVVRWSDVNRLLVMWGQHHCRPLASGVCRPGCHFQDLCALVWGKPSMRFAIPNS